MAVSIEGDKKVTRTFSLRRMARGALQLIAANNFPLINPGYRELLKAHESGEELPQDHPARRLPIL